MRVTITGAAGGLGSTTGKVLHEAGIEVVGIDRVSRDDLPFKVHVADLCDAEAVKPHVQNIDAVLHFGNHTDHRAGRELIVYSDNVKMNMNVFWQAHLAGCGKMFFASSIQVISSVPNYYKSKPVYLPLDSDTPARVSNEYALSKHAGEDMLQWLADMHGVSAVSFRYPYMQSIEKFRKLFAERDKSDMATGWDEVLAFSYMSYEDAGRLALAALRADLPGHRVYLPASQKRFTKSTNAELIARYYADVPLKKTIAEIGEGSLVDITRITAETGWLPKD